MSDHHNYDQKVESSPSPNYESEAPHEPSAGEYARTRLSTLKPPMNKAPNPITLLRMLNGKQWLFFLCGFIAWVYIPILFWNVVAWLTVA
jgi:SHS family lactate transporter-like MFS transporter